MLPHPAFGHPLPQGEGNSLPFQLVQFLSNHPQMLPLLANQGLEHRLAVRVGGLPDEVAVVVNPLLLDVKGDLQRLPIARIETDVFLSRPVRFQFDS